MQSSQPIASSSSSAIQSSSTSTANGKPDRLYVGNLSPTVDEYTLIQIFSKYGKITKLDFMFHKTGVLKGKPRGFAFIQFTDKDDALKAMIKLHDRLLRGRKLVVTYASSAPPENLPLINTKGRRPNDPSKTTTLSLLKSSKKPQSAAAQIAAMEAKLAHMKRTKPADEDYVPGLGGSTPSSRNGTPGVEESPMPEEQGEEVEMGEEEAERAAEELEREMKDLVNQERSSTLLPIDRSRSSTSVPVGDEAKKIPLPPRPVDDAELEIAIPPTSSTTEGRSKRREEAFKRGLAGLPKKPVF
ncbi:single-stranded nucleic acid binding protein [Kwoniella mangroviensis CBS 8886]|uniref:uncharacterized protein n=1 Tax=Kwoniella mangroviensis CBS 8507 TaxID=1296122 RepID=UPI00080D80DE|nr:single-stranded nucleic acid binding protein [Kwoniella mangroviensis CBS 8507]OCF64867.1 single-stranded nucleic acid binding protein [Kwoniella mangroviensis CBS 8507]OCF77334.1 single-stranded nucleic acid binding protein [Kwoniella mangroviensis CBS 8886]